jgi:Cu/Ag efflux protein CusF
MTLHRIAQAAGALALLATTTSPATAQTKSITYETKVETVTVEAIEASTRTLTLKKADGTHVTSVAPKSMTRFPEIKIGDKVTARYYENLVIRVKQPGEKDTDTVTGGITRSMAAHPGGTAATQRTITATITAIDMATPSITFSGPNKWTYSSRVEDKKALEKVKVGDRVDIVWTDALLISLDAAK